jgi:hypothetical protein
MVALDDNEDEKKGRNADKPEGNKKAKERLRLEGEAALLRDKFDQMMKSKEVITETKKEVSLQSLKPAERKQGTRPSWRR